MVSINPKKLSGNWSQGYALDVHTTGSIFLGSDEFGHDVFDTTRSAIGELLYRLKYKSDKTALNEIIDTVADFLNNKWKIVTAIDAIIPVPPSKARAVWVPPERNRICRRRVPAVADQGAIRRRTPVSRRVISISCNPDW